MIYLSLDALFPSVLQLISRKHLCQSEQFATRTDSSFPTCTQLERLENGSLSSCSVSLILSAVEHLANPVKSTLIEDVE